MEPTIAELAQNYSLLADEVLVKLATEETHSLRKEALVVLLKELSKRDIPQEAIDCIELQLNINKPGALENLVAFVRQQPCPKCGQSDKQLNATKVETVFSLIVMSDRVSELRIACPDCLDGYHLKGNLFTLAFGWWGFPGGLYKPFMAFWNNYKLKKINHEPTASPLLNLFVRQNVPKFKLHERNPAVLRKILKEAFIKGME